MPAKKEPVESKAPSEPNIEVDSLHFIERIRKALYDVRIANATDLKNYIEDYKSYLWLLGSQRHDGLTITFVKSDKTDE